MDQDAHEKWLLSAVRKRIDNFDGEQVDVGSCFFYIRGRTSKDDRGAILQSADMPIEHMVLSGRELAEMFVMRKF